MILWYVKTWTTTSDSLDEKIFYSLHNMKVYFYIYLCIYSFVHCKISDSQLCFLSRCPQTEAGLPTPAQEAVSPKDHKINQVGFVISFHYNVV